MATVYYAVFILINIRLLFLSYTHNHLYSQCSNRARQLWQVFIVLVGLMCAGLYFATEVFQYIEYGGVPLIMVVLFTFWIAADKSQLATLEMGLADKNPKLAIDHFLSLANMIEDSKGEGAFSEALLGLYVAYHHSKCTRNRCPLSKDLPLDTGKSTETETKDWRLQKLKQAVGLHLREATLTTPWNIDLKLLYVAYVRKYLKSYIEAWATIDGVLLSECNFIQRLHLYCFKFGFEVFTDCGLFE